MRLKCVYTRLGLKDLFVRHLLISFIKYFPDFSVKQLEKEVRELTKQRDLAESRVEDLLRIVGNDQGSRQWVCIVVKLLQNLVVPGCCCFNS